MRHTPENITSLGHKEIFVFGSNLKGIMGAGAAKLAHQKFGAVWGRGVGFAGSTYAIPTKDHNIQTMSIAAIKPYVDQFIKFAAANLQLTFLVTPIGTGLAGIPVAEIAPLFKGPLSANVILPKVFVDFLSQ